ncbi:hypothetical protein EDD15DRAFT_2230998 [Pisolithus albus]|nr:hypothetical protein EDD15DRAFT_2230998 [Pisolithus albus]
MVGNQSKKYRRPLGFAKPSSSMSNRPSNTPLEPSQTPPTGDSAPSTGIPDNTSRGALARIKCIFRRPRQIHPSSIAVDTAHTIAGQGAQEQQEQAQESQEQVQPLPAQDTQISTDEPELDPVPASVANDVNAAVKAFDDMDPVPLISARAIDIVGRANTSFNDIQNFSDMYLKPFIVFNEVVKTLTKVGVSSFTIRPMIPSTC